MADSALPTAPTVTTIPVMACRDVDELADFYEALGFRTTYRQAKPYVYVAVEGRGFGLHFSRVPAGADTDREDVGCCLVIVDDVAAMHADLSATMRSAFGKVLAKGRPRITRYRPGASRFTLVDPSGNSLIFIQADIPEEVDYGGAAHLTGLAKALDNARIFRDFKLDDKAALRAVTSALKRHSKDASPAQLGTALAVLVELATALGDDQLAAQRLAELRALDLTEADWAVVEPELRNTELLQSWRDGTSPPRSPSPHSSP